MSSKLDKTNPVKPQEEYPGLSSKHLGIAVVVIAVFAFAAIVASQQNPSQGMRGHELFVYSRQQWQSESGGKPG